jgi:hypothetical protein
MMGLRYPEPFSILTSAHVDSGPDIDLSALLPAGRRPKLGVEPRPQPPLGGWVGWFLINIGQ